MDRLNDYDFSLPPELIATTALVDRSQSRLMCLLKGDARPRHDRFLNISSYLKPGDVLVVNNTKVMKARLLAFKETGGRAEILLVRAMGGGLWQALINTSGRLRIGSTLMLANSDDRVRVVDRLTEQGGGYLIECHGDLSEIAKRMGTLPLPPYFNRQVLDGDEKSYQTIFAKELGAVAAPTAGLHFTAGILDELQNQNVRIVEVTLHVGPGTFLPVRCEDIAQHKMHGEIFRMDQSCAEVLNEALDSGARIIPVGSTAMRVVEQVMHLAEKSGQARFFSCSGETAIYIRPGYRFLASSAIITNFHLPKSTLIILVSAIAGRDRVLAAYQEAIAQKYRFFSYGDACFFEIS